MTKRINTTISPEVRAFTMRRVDHHIELSPLSPFLLHLSKELTPNLRERENEPFPFILIRGQWQRVSDIAAVEGHKETTATVVFAGVIPTAPH
ncbi:hypothetical protein Nepgr_005485 [Nepenthes gracilis]|uniref:Uncharacterized protein n=1 Tax=Nepenthes gracilis TaxID=150966 RepID=A0AAD3XGN0_NEPGR|nr:hypothetical protein Nepgr_005485 [Nepenthes gracilis]